PLSRIRGGGVPEAPGLSRPGFVAATFYILNVNFLTGRFSVPDGDATTIAMVSGKGGVGKTVTTANLAIALQEIGETVATVDCDTGAADLALHLGLPVPGEDALQAALADDDAVVDAIRLHDTGLMVLPAAHTMHEEVIDRTELERVLDRLHGTVLIDAPPGLDRNVHTIMDVADEIIIVTNPEIPAVSDAVAVAEAVRMEHDSGGDASAVVTKADELAAEVTETQIESALDVPVIGTVPYDYSLKEAINAQEPVLYHTPHARSAIAYRDLAAWIAGTAYRPPSFSRVKRVIDSVQRRFP
ncbi:MAG: P-loop NTPase, partial [Candidatus Nanohaloarchaea archaeon]